jgi:drug/metabolite transporter (DMT)-like permease
MMSGHLMGLFVAITFGSAYPVGKPLISAVDPVSFSCFRYLVAGALMLLLAHGTGRQISVSRKDLLALTGLGLLGYTLFQGVWAIALDMTTPSKAVILVATAPIFGAFFALIAGQSVGRMIWVGAGVAFLGVYLVVNNGLIPQGMAGGDQFIGDMLFVFIAAVWSLFGLLSRPYVMRLGAWTTTGWAALLGAIILMPFGWEGMTDGGWGRIDWTLGLSFLHLALVVGCLGNAAWSGGLGRLGLPKMVLYLYLSPVVGAGISAVWLGDWLSPIQIAGAALVIGGVALGQSGGISLKRRSLEKHLRTSP